MPARDSTPERTGTATVPDLAPARPRHDPLPEAAPAGTIPTQRSGRPVQPGPSAPVPPAPGTVGRPERARSPRLPGAVLVVLLCLALVGAVATAVVLQLRADARASAWAHAQERVAAASAAQQVDEAFWAQARTAEVAARYQALVADARTRSGVVLTEARAVLAASPHAGDALAALQTAIDGAATATEQLGAGVSPAALAVGTRAIAAPQQAAVDAQAAWQAAEDARIAAERAAAERAAAEAAQRAAAGRGTGGARAARPAVSSGGGGGGAAPAAAAPTAWAAGVASYGIGGLGAEINAARTANGLATLAVVGSSTLANHAAAMAAAGSIWHSGNDHIVGWVEPSSDSEMIKAYLNSPPHRAWILKDGKSTVAIGAVTLNGRLYTAMVFS